MNTFKTLFMLMLVFTISACSTSKSRYSIKNDHAPKNVPKLDHITSVEPKYEAYSRGGNKDYTVFGKDYDVWNEINYYEEKGVASWYGNKFHGHLTSNGERYDMYGMSAAHKSLPIPSYVKVTNLANNKEIIVRVNDRGPFHSNRIIDLSYVAAYKLGMLSSGTANVKVSLIKVLKSGEIIQSKNETDIVKTQKTDPELMGVAGIFDQEEEIVVSKPISIKADKPNITPAEKIKQPISTIKETSSVITNEEYYIQYFVTSQIDKAKNLTAQIKNVFKNESSYLQVNDLFKLRLGPVANFQDAQKILDKLHDQYPNAFLIKPL